MTEEQDAQGPTSGDSEGKLEPEALITATKKLADRLMTGLSDSIDVENLTSIELKVTKDGVIYKCNVLKSGSPTNPAISGDLSKSGVEPYFSRDSHFISDENYGYLIARGTGRDNDGTEFPQGLQTDSKVALDAANQRITEFLDAFKPAQRK